MSRKLLISVIVGHFVLCFLSYYLLVNNYVDEWWWLVLILMGLVAGSPLSFILLVRRGTKETTYKEIIGWHLKAFGILVGLIALDICLIHILAVFFYGLFFGLPGVVVSCCLQLIICFLENRCKGTIPEE